MHIKTAGKKRRLVMSKSEWLSIGKKAGWTKKASMFDHRNDPEPPEFDEDERAFLGDDEVMGDSVSSMADWITDMALAKGMDELDARQMAKRITKKIADTLGGKWAKQWELDYLGGPEKGEHFE